jgi:hypothetical protein
MRPLLFLLPILVLSLPACASRSASNLPVIKVTLGSKTIRAEVAQTAAAQARGLMYRRDLGWNKGMLFVYEDEKILSFWMENTFVPLSIAFLDPDGQILHIAHMEPLSKTSHRSPTKALYALEMNQGWFEKEGVRVGDRAEFELPDPQ